jgi:hypothetical protein
MKKKCIIFFNCHGGEIFKQLKSSDKFSEIYETDFIPLYDYLDGYKFSNENDLIEYHKKLLGLCDILILQYIKNNTKNIINHEHIKTLVKKDCIIFTIPHYTFSGYHPYFDIVNDTFINENKNKNELEIYIDNLFLNEKDKILKNLNDEFENIKKLDEFSDIKCLDFIKKNYNKYQLFYSRSYPTYVLFHYIAQQILNKLNINELINPIYTSYANHTTEPIFQQVKYVLNIQFDFKLNYGCNLTEYLICCKINNVNSIVLENKKKGKIYVEKILEIIKNNKYR